MRTFVETVSKESLTQVLHLKIKREMQIIKASSWYGVKERKMVSLKNSKNLKFSLSLVRKFLPTVVSKNISKQQVQSSSLPLEFMN